MYSILLASFLLPRIASDGRRDTLCNPVRNTFLSSIIEYPEILKVHNDGEGSKGKLDRTWKRSVFVVSLLTERERIMGNEMCGYAMEERTFATASVI